MLVFWPTAGGYGRPMGLLRGVGSKVETRLPYDFGASLNWEEGGGTTVSAGVGGDDSDGELFEVEVDDTNLIAEFQACCSRPVLVPKIREE